MNNVLIIYPVVLMIILTLYLYVKNSYEVIKAAKNKIIKYKYFKAYQGEVPEYIEVLRQTLKNQFELPILFYFLVSLIIFFDNLTIVDLIFAWSFVMFRYIHCYIRLTSNYLPYRARVFMIGLFILVAAWINFLISINFFIF